MFAPAPILVIAWFLTLDPFQEEPMENTSYLYDTLLDVRVLPTGTLDFSF